MTEHQQRQDRFNVKAVIQSAYTTQRGSDQCCIGRSNRMRPSPKEKDTEGRSFLMGDRRVLEHAIVWPKVLFLELCCGAAGSVWFGLSGWQVLTPSSAFGRPMLLGRGMAQSKAAVGSPEIQVVIRQVCAIKSKCMVLYLILVTQSSPTSSPPSHSTCGSPT